MLHVAGNHRSNREVGFGGALGKSCHQNLRDEFSFEARALGEDEGASYPSGGLLRDSSPSPSSPLLPCERQHSNLSSRTRLQVIVEARKELMEMIQDMPESSYELSLKDLVDEHHQKGMNHYRSNDDDLAASYHDERSFRFETDNALMNQQQQKQKKRKKKMERIESSGSTYSSSSDKFSRSTSMGSEIFLIRMFSFPSCFGNCKSKQKHTTHGNGSSKVSPRNSFVDDHKEPMIIKRMFSAGEKKVGGKTCSSRSSSSNSDCFSKNRLAGNFSPGCWPFLQIKNSKAKKKGWSMGVSSD